MAYNEDWEEVERWNCRDIEEPDDIEPEFLSTGKRYMDNYEKYLSQFGEDEESEENNV